MRQRIIVRVFVLGLLSVMLGGAPVSMLQGQAQEGTPTADASPGASADASPVAAGGVGSVFATGPWRISIAGAIRRSGIAGADLESRADKDWVLVLADVTNWGDDDDTLEVKKFGVRSRGEKKASGLSQKYSTSAAAKLKTEPADASAGVAIDAGDTVRVTLVFQVSDDLENPVLVMGKTVVSLADVLEERLSLRTLPPIVSPPALQEVEVDEVVDGGILSTFDAEDANRRVRLAGVDLPVGDECFADDAIDQVTELTSDVVWLETEPNAADDEDLTGYAWVDQEGQKVLVNQRMIAEGFGAYAVSEGTVRFRDWLSESEVIAKAQGAGLWGTCTGPHGTLAPTPTPEPVGTRDNPVEFGEEAEVGDWAFVVTDVAPDATELVLAQNQFNDPPADGRQFFMVAISATYNGKESSSLSIVGLRAVGESNVAYDYRDVCSYDIPDPLPSTEVFEGGTVSGNYCWSVRTEDVDSLVMYVDVGYTSDNRVYFSLRKE